MHLFLNPNLNAIYSIAAKPIKACGSSIFYQLKLNACRLPTAPTAASAGRAVATVSKLAFALCCALSLALAGCATPQSPIAKAVYDFGPATPANATNATNATDTTNPAAPIRATVPLTLADVQAHAALEAPTVVYRLAYADAQQLRPYTLARWSAPPAQLVHQRLGAALARSGPVLAPADGPAAWLLKVELGEFSQHFDTPTTSQGLVQLRATLLQANRVVAQRTITAQAPAPSADAAGGVKALTNATDDAVQQINAWVALHMR
jgi:cholesterol transport system auxiliary component